MDITDTFQTFNTKILTHVVKVDKKKLAFWNYLS